MTGFETAALFDFSGTLAEALLARCRYPWEALPQIGAYAEELARALAGRPGWREIAPGAVAAESAAVSPLASVTGPAVVGPGAELRPGAYVRGKAVVCAGCVVGNSTELKNCVLLDGAKLPHFSYAGDSVIGRGAHFGAGTVASNLRLDGADVVVRDRQTGLAFATGLRKVGAFVGDGAELGCRCVLNPGTVVGRRAAVCPGAVLSGRIPEDSLVRADGRTARRTAGSGAE